MLVTVSRLWSSLNRGNRLLLTLAMLLIAMSAVTDLLVVGGVMPLVAMFTTEAPFSGRWAQLALNFVGLQGQSMDRLKVIVSIAYLGFIVIALVVKTLSTFVLFQFTHRVGTEYAALIFRRSMAVSYEQYLNRRASDLISALTLKCNDVVQYYTSILQILVATLNLTTLIAFLLIVDFALAFSVAAFIGAVYGLIYAVARARLAANGKVAAASASKFVGLAREGLTGYRDVLLEGLGDSFVRRFVASHHAYMEALGRNSLIGTTPKLFFDFAVYLIIVLILNKMIPGGADYLSDLAKVGSFALAMQRVSPLAHTLYNSLSNVYASRESIRDVLQVIDENVPIERKLIAFRDSIELTGVSFIYGGTTQEVLSNFNLRINRSDWLVIVGKSGSGKSTLLDLILGLLSPTSGEIRVNDERVEGGKFLYGNIGHVSQQVHIFESSIFFNITLEEIPDEASVRRAWQCLELVELKDHVDLLPNGIWQHLGDSGTGLSGGQRQRLGIARALFNGPALLVLDEATSAIDEGTAEIVMRNIRRGFPDMTCIRITHRLSDVQPTERLLVLDFL